MIAKLFAHVIFEKEYWGRKIAKDVTKHITKWFFDNLVI